MTMNYVNIAKLICAVSALASFSGCSIFNPIGESTFDCNRKDNPSEYCRSFKAMEASTNGKLPESRFDKEFRMSDYDRKTGVAPDDQPSSKTTQDKNIYNNVLPHNLLPATGEAIAGAPVRRAPVIQRVWIKDFVDENDLLHGDTVVYKEIQGSKWTGFDASTNSDTNQLNGVNYPHKAKNSLFVPLEPQAQPVQTSNNFSQPGVSAPVNGETAPLPAVSGSNSMPN